MHIDDVLADYKRVRHQARRTRTFRLRRQERQARAATLGSDDQFRFARLAAIRDELRARGIVVPPVQRGLP